MVLIELILALFVAACGIAVIAFLFMVAVRLTTGRWPFVGQGRN